MIRAAELATSLQEKMVQRRRYLHQHLELSFQEHETSRWVSERIEELGVRFEGTVRTLSEETRSLVERKMEQIIKGVCEGTGASYDLRYERGYPPLVNHPEETEVVRRAVEGSGRCALVEMKPIMGGEDFAYYLEEVPGCFFFVGAGNGDKEAAYPHHHPRFDIDEDALSVGLEALLATYLQYTATS